MRKFLLFAALCFAGSAFAQKIYTTDYSYQADFKVFVVKYEYMADLVVYRTDRECRATDNKGIWYFTDKSYRADKKIYFTDYEYQADLKIYFTDSEYKAVWKKNSKKHLLY